MGNTKLSVSNSRDGRYVPGWNPLEFVEESESDGEGKESEARVEYEAEAAFWAGKSAPIEDCKFRCVEHEAEADSAFWTEESALKHGCKKS